MSAHFRERLLERYGIEATDDDLIDAVRQIQDGSTSTQAFTPHWARKSSTRRWHSVTIQGQRVLVVFSRKKMANEKNKLVTALPPKLFDQYLGYFDNLWNLPESIPCGENVDIPLWRVLAEWKPGSGDDSWSWVDEVADLLRRDRPIIESMMACRVDEPVWLGSDGRVWDGHHRIVAAMLTGRGKIPCLVVEAVPQPHS